MRLQPRLSFNLHINIGIRKTSYSCSSSAQTPRLAAIRPPFSKWFSCAQLEASARNSFLAGAFRDGTSLLRGESSCRNAEGRNLPSAKFLFASDSSFSCAGIQVIVSAFYWSLYRGHYAINYIGQSARAVAIVVAPGFLSDR